MTAAAPSIHHEDTCFLSDPSRCPTRCQHARCAFWDPERGCTPKRLGLEEQADARPELADWLRTLRSELSSQRLEVRPELLPPYALLPDPGFRR